MIRGVRVTVVVAMAENRIIGRDNALPWHLPADLRHFKEVTLGKPMVMGRRTHESIGRPLPGRTNIVVSRNPDFRADGCTVVSSLDEAAVVAVGENAGELMVIGGAALYEAALPVTDLCHVTVVHREYEGDTAFPELDGADWDEVSRERVEASSTDDPDLSFLVLARRAAASDAAP